MLFGSVKITDKRKGIDYLIESCRLLADKHPELREQLGVVVFGNQSQQLENLLPFKVYPLNFVSNEHQLVNIYNAVDIFVTPRWKRTCRTPSWKPWHAAFPASDSTWAASLR